MKRLRVLNVFHHLMPSGAEVMWMTASEDFKRLGIDHVVMSVDQELGPYADEMRRSFEIDHLPLSNGPDGVFPILHKARALKADLVQCHSEQKGAACAMAGLLGGLPVVRTYHNVWSSVSVKHQIRRRIEAWHATRVAIGPSVQEVENRWGPTELISNWALAETNRQRPTASETVRLVTVCNTNPIKNCGYMVQLAASDPQIDLTHIGFDGEGDFEAPRLAALSVQDRVRSIGPQVDAASRVTEFDAFICTSKWEGYGVALHEAIVAGVPVIILDTPGVRDILDYCPHAFVIDPGAARPLDGLRDSIQAQLDDYEEGLEGLRERFSPQRGALEYANLYRRLCKP